MGQILTRLVDMGFSGPHCSYTGIWFQSDCVLLCVDYGNKYIFKVSKIKNH